MKYFTKQGFQGRWNGYVIVPHDHPLIKSGVLDPSEDRWCDALDLDVHGGITFNEIVDGRDNWKGWPVKNVPHGSIIVGFDTNHMSSRLKDWPRHKVQNEARRLKAQLLALTNKLETAPK